MVYLSKLSIKTSMCRALYFRWRQRNGMFPIETSTVAYDNNDQDRNRLQTEPIYDTKFGKIGIGLMKPWQRYQWKRYLLYRLTWVYRLVHFLGLTAEYPATPKHYLKGCVEKSPKWLLINYQILLPNCLVSACEKKENLKLHQVSLGAKIAM